MNVPPGDVPDPHEDNTYGLPDGTPLRGALKTLFAAQAALLLGTLPEIGAPLPDAFPALADWDDPLARACTPLISAYWDEAGQTNRARLGLDPDEWRVTDPHTEAKIRGAVFSFCESTNNTTALALGAALDKLRDELVAGIVQEGESIPELRKRVQKVFGQADRFRADRIARTEAARAVHAASLESAKQSGVVAGKRWLLSSNACPRCQAAAAKTKDHPLPLDAAFEHAEGGNPAYADPDGPPLHPFCCLPGTPVVAPLTLAGITAHYDGPVVRVDFADGSHVTVTPNHMLMTPEGFVTAAGLMEGDNLIRYAVRKGMAGGNPDHDRKPAPIEQIVEALAVAGGVPTCRVPVAAEYLHGDARFCQGDINVVAPDGFLGHDLHAPTPEPTREGLFGGAVESSPDLAREGGLATVLFALRDASDGGVSATRESAASLRAHATHADMGCGAGVAPLDTGFEQSVTDRGAADAESP